MKFITLFLSLSLAASPAVSGCVDGEIEAVFAEFAASIAVQKNLAAERVTVSELDATAEPEPAMVSRELARSELDWPLIPDTKALLQAGGSISYADAPEGVFPAGKLVTLRGDNGYRVELLFTKTPCWQLRAIKDDSL